MKHLILAAFAGLVLSGSTPAQFTLDSLPYAFNALEPVIDARTMEIHFTRHHAGYVTNLNKALKEAGLEKSTDLIPLFNDITRYSAAIRNNGGGHYNHTLFWKILTPDTTTAPSKALTKAIEASFGSMEKCRTLLVTEGLTRFGSGWAWLVVTADKKLAITSTPNQDNPLMSDATVRGTPILGIDVWEHAYYLQYQNKRGDYLQALWKIINWKKVSELYEGSLVTR